MRRVAKMKKGRMVLVVAVLFLFPGLTQSQPVRPEPGGRPEALQIVQLEMVPDPVREGERIRFGLTLFNRTSISGRANILIKDRNQDEVVAEVRGVLIQPGSNHVAFPDSGYRFTRREHCFTVAVDIAGTRRPVDFAGEFCARRAYSGWTMAQAVIGPFLVEGLEIYPDPFQPGQRVGFKARLKNGGIPVRATIRVQDRDEIVAMVDQVRMEPGSNDYWFPETGYSLQRGYHCFTVAIEVEGKTYPAETTRELCTRSLGWTLRP
jgi:hypothetical protein